MSAAIAQLGERQTEDLKVPGSIPGRGRSRSTFGSGMIVIWQLLIGGSKMCIYKYVCELKLLKNLKCHTSKKYSPLERGKVITNENLFEFCFAISS